MGTKNNPGKYEFLEKLEDDEPFFVLAGRDRTAANRVRDWADINEETDRQPPDKIEEARKCADAMDEWRKARKGV